MIGTLKLFDRKPSVGLRERQAIMAAEIEFTDKDPLEVIRMLEDTLGILRERFEAKQDKPQPVKPRLDQEDEEDDEDEPEEKD